MLVQKVDAEAVADFAREQGLEFVVLFGSQSTGRARDSSDTDLALMPGAPRSREEVETALVHRLRRADLDLVWLPHAPWLLAAKVAEQGRVLFECEPGRFHRFAIRAALRRADSRLWHERNRQFVSRFLERSLIVDRELVTQKLALMTEYLGRLEQVVEPPLAEFQGDFRLFQTAERNLELLVECAAAINTEVAQSVANIPPSDYYRSFFSLASAGWLEPDVAARLAEMAGLRNRLVHQYEGIDLKQLYSSLKRSLADWRAYLESVSSRA